MNTNIEKRKSLLFTFILIISLTLGTIVAFFLFYKSNLHRISSQNENYIADIATQRAKLINDLFDENLSYIESSTIVIETELIKQELNPSALDFENENDIDANAISTISNVLKIV